MKKKTTLAFFLSICMLNHTAAGCGRPEKEPQKEPATQQTSATEHPSETESIQNFFNTEQASAETTTEITEPESAEPGFSYADLSGYEFQFSSGVGAWGTSMTIEEDGSFHGEYHDTDMGDISEGYPGGTLYLSSFTGNLSKPEKVNEYTYSAKLLSIQTERPSGEEEITDDTRYVYSDAYGIYDAKEILIYLPGAPLAELPAQFLGWVHYNDLSSVTETELPFYGLYNVAAECGFSGYQTTGSQTDQTATEAEIAAVQSQANDLETKLATAQTQLEMNETAAEIYRLWDDELNVLWKRLKETLDSATMDALTKEEHAWISAKEQEMAAAGGEFAGGSMQAMAEYQKGADLTRNRVYELAEYLKSNTPQ